MKSALLAAISSILLVGGCQTTAYVDDLRIRELEARIGQLEADMALWKSTPCEEEIDYDE